jgi:hypothetical protein
MTDSTLTSQIFERSEFPPISVQTVSPIKSFKSTHGSYVSLMAIRAIG